MPNTLLATFVFVYTRERRESAGKTPRFLKVVLKKGIRATRITRVAERKFFL